MAISLGTCQLNTENGAPLPSPSLSFIIKGCFLATTFVSRVQMSKEIMAGVVHRQQVSPVISFLWSVASSNTERFFCHL